MPDRLGIYTSESEDSFKSIEQMLKDSAMYL